MSSAETSHQSNCHPLTYPPPSQPASQQRANHPPALAVVAADADAEAAATVVRV